MHSALNRVLSLDRDAPMRRCAAVQAAMFELANSHFRVDGTDSMAKQTGTELSPEIVE